MNALWRAVGLSSGIPNFPYTIGEAFDEDVSKTIPNPYLKLFHGTKSSSGDSGPVTIFKYDLSEGANPSNTPSPSNEETLRNAAKKAKAMMLPGCLRCFDAVEHNNAFYFATEECVPLNFVLGCDRNRDSYYEDEEKFQHAVALGVHTVCSSLAALHKNGAIHGSVNADSIYVLKNGGWKLFGYELMSQSAEEYPLYKKYVNSLPEHRRAPELASGSGGTGAAATAVDAWGVGCLIYETFHATSHSTKAADLKSGRNTPRELQAAVSGLIATNPKLRTQADKFLQSDYFADDPFVTMINSLDELSLKDQADRDRYYRELAAAADGFPLVCCKFMLLPKLTNAVQYGGGSATVLEPLLKIGARLSSEEFGELVSPIVLALFKSTDHMVRCRLLATADAYAKYLPTALVSEKIWPTFVGGFSSKNAELRELTVRATVHFAPTLTEKLLTTDVVHHLSHMQKDPEGPIRTNATVCLGFIGKSLPDSLRAKTLITGFGRMLKDPFHPSRSAAVKCISAALEEFPAEAIATQLLPAMAPLALDKFADVRTAALRSMQLMSAKLEDHAKTMEDAALQQQSNPTPPPAASSNAGPPVAANASQSTPPPASTKHTDPVQPQEESNSSGGWGGWFGKKKVSESSNSLNSTSNGADQTPLPSNPSIDSIEEEKPAAPRSPKAPSRLSKVGQDSPSPPPQPTAASPAPVTATARPGGMKLGARKKGLGGAKVD